MKIVVLADESLKAELLCQGQVDNVQVEWVTDSAALLPFDNKDVFIDLMFEATAERIELVQQLMPKPVLVNSVNSTLSQLPAGLVRLNGWNSFLKRPVIEASCSDDLMKARAMAIFSAFHKTAAWVPDVAGFISARVISMIINEAYFALQDKVSTKTEIDTAMKLGTHYPYGPFEWSEMIGLKKVGDLLTSLSKTDSRYEPADLLIKEADL